MTCELASTALSDEQKGQVLGILSVGCDRHTAASFVGCSLADIRQTMQQDAAFAASLCRAEAGAELSHMRNVQQAATDTKNWRASTWWLERRSPERFGPRGPGVVTARQLKSFIAIVGDTLREVIRGDDDRQQMLSQLQTLADSVEQMLRDSHFDRDRASGGLQPISPGAALGPPQESDAADAVGWDNECMG